MKSLFKLGLLITILLSAAPRAFGWGREGHKVIVLIAERNMSAAALKKARAILGRTSFENIGSWADYYRRRHPETGPWHYINIPLADDKIDLRAACPRASCVVVKIEQFLAVLKDPRASQPEKARALKFVVHLVGDLHQPLHCENDHDRGGNERRVIFHAHRDNLHWVWDVGLLNDLNRNADSLAEELERKITAQDRAAWSRGSVKDWAMQSHRLAQTVAYRDLSDPPVINRMYEQEVDPVVDLQLERAGVRLAFLLDRSLR